MICSSGALLNSGCIQAVRQASQERVVGRQQPQRERGSGGRTPALPGVLQQAVWLIRWYSLSCSVMT